MQRQREAAAREVDLKFHSEALERGAAETAVVRAREVEKRTQMLGFADTCREQLEKSQLNKILERVRMFVSIFCSAACK